MTSGILITSDLLCTGYGDVEHMMVIIDRDTCVGCGSCQETCPSLFEEDPDDSRIRIRESFQIGKNRAEGKPEGALEGCAQEAAGLCPVEIIAIHE